MTTCPICGHEFTHAQATMDARTQAWRIRVRLYHRDRRDEPEADSDPDLSPDRQGTTVVHGLPAVAEELSVLASRYHGVECIGLEREVLLHKLKSLRPTLSRRGGDAVWRVTYTTPTGEWLARVDVAREPQQEAKS